MLSLARNVKASARYLNGPLLEQYSVHRVACYYSSGTKSRVSPCRMWSWRTSRRRGRTDWRSVHSCTISCRMRSTTRPSGLTSGATTSRSPSKLLSEYSLLIVLAGFSLAAYGTRHKQVESGIWLINDFSRVDRSERREGSVGLDERFVILVWCVWRILG